MRGGLTLTIAAVVGGLAIALGGSFSLGWQMCPPTKFQPYSYAYADTLTMVAEGGLLIMTGPGEGRSDTVRYDGQERLVVVWQRVYQVGGEE